MEVYPQCISAKTKTTPACRYPELSCLLDHVKQMMDPHIQINVPPQSRLHQFPADVASHHPTAWPADSHVARGVGWDPCVPRTKKLDGPRPRDTNLTMVFDS